jgi:hypothetical protein
MSNLAQLLQAPGATVEADDDFDTINALVLDRGWSDGLPVVPPSTARVEAMLAYCDRPWNEPVASIPPRYGEATPLRLAANAVMAGCRPEYFPLIVTAVEGDHAAPLKSPSRLGPFARTRGLPGRGSAEGVRPKHGT